MPDLELDALKEQLAFAVGRGGRDWPWASSTEEARVKVTTVVREAIARIARHDAELGHHLSTCIRSTGTFCSYHPTTSGKWVSTV